MKLDSPSSPEFSDAADNDSLAIRSLSQLLVVLQQSALLAAEAFELIRRCRRFRERTTRYQIDRLSR
jgi:hypothetical protein